MQRYCAAVGSLRGSGRIRVLPLIEIVSKIGIAESSLDFLLVAECQLLLLNIKSVPPCFAAAEFAVARAVGGVPCRSAYS